ncbi:O-antigen polymerase [Sphingobacterium spiritivorum]|uniref:O-antigen polymerase n=1 Tax=Sphingobacterium spiritivorum TaxID=258 RepID=UPI003DA69553
MEYIVFIILSLFVIVGLLTSRSWLAPEVLSPLSWLSILIIYYTFDHGMLSLSDDVLSVILIWNCSLLIGMYISKSVNASVKDFAGMTSFSPKLRDLYFKISIIGFLPTLYIIYQQVSALEGDFFYRLRAANVGIAESKISLGIFAYVLTFAFVSYMIELISYQRGQQKLKLYIILLINIAFAVSTMSKSSFLFLIVSSLFVLSAKVRLPIKKVLTYVLLTFFFMFGVQKLRDGSESKSSTATTLYLYMLAGVPALDKIVQSDMTSRSSGQNTMAFINNVRSKLVGADKEKKGYVGDVTYEGYIAVPSPYLTNVYTVIGPIWLDFRYTGLIICSLIVGWFSRYYYKLSIKGYQWASILYAYFACVLILQFFGEYIFTNLSYLIQLIVLSYLPYRFRNLKIKWSI